MSPDVDTLARRAGELGVETSYRDVDDQLHQASPATLGALVDILEADRDGGPTDVEPVVVAGTGPVSVGRLRGVALELEGGGTVVLTGADGHVELPADLPIGSHRLRGELDGGRVEEATVVVAPPVMPWDPRLAGREGALFVPAYALWERDRPDPSYAHLRRLAGDLTERGIAVLSTLPLYAAFLDEPFEPSPYAPVSRLHWNEAYLAGAGTPDAGGARAPALAADELVDWRAVGARRRQDLLHAAGDLDAPTVTAVAEFVAARPDVGAFARFCAGRGAAGDAGPPAATVERSYALGQYLAHVELAGIEGHTTTILALDLPIGSHPEGFETHAHPELFAPGVAVGAPPDEFFAEGQNWGFPPSLPGAGRRSGHDLWRRLVARAGEHASVLRIDHVMGVQRLWWIPEGHSGADGAFVSYPREELLAVVAAAATRSATTIVGEDLGTVSDEVRAALERWGVIGLYEEQFHLDRRPLPQPGRARVAGLRTHDMPAFAAVVAAAPDELAGYGDELAADLGHPVDDATLADAALERLAGTEAVLVIADLDDLLGETTPHNIPGRVLPTNWRRRLPAPTTEVLADPIVNRRLAHLARRGAPS